MMLFIYNCLSIQYNNGRAFQCEKLSKLRQEAMHF